jgi:hypothetical protein
MTIIPQTTRQGKLIHRLSPGDLVDAVVSGGRLRAYCPIHGGDHQRSLSIELATGWGFCHCCHVTVLLETVPPTIVGRPVKGHDRHGTDGGTFIGTLSGSGASKDHLPAPSVQPSLAQRGQSATPLPLWQREEVAALRAVAPLMREALATSRRAQLYLSERGLPPALALASGVGYLSRTVWEQAPVSAEQQSLLRRWMGRIVFPLGSPAGQGFIGRTLLRWEPGMDENAHKALLDLPGAPRRWIKTSPAGWFGFDPPGRLLEQLILVEGGFDRLALLAAGFPANAVIALVGTAARPSWLAQSAPQVKSVVLALDADNCGNAAMERLVDKFRQAGLAVTLCLPPHDQWGKDWSERWRRLGPQSMWPLYEAVAHTRRHRKEGRA